MPIDVTCPHCDTTTAVASKFAGKRGKCPGCGEKIQVPHPGPLPVPKPPPAPAVASAPKAAASPSTRPCPFCAEPIAAAAKKCKHCGEFLDGRPVAVSEAGTVTTEKTGKKWKAMQLIGGAMMLGGLIAFGTCVGLLANSGATRDGVSTTLAAASSIGFFAMVLGFPIALVGRIGGWWFHG